jgi:hypothetical protein
MNRTPTLALKLPDTPAREQIARHTVAALAIKAGLPPLAADRAAVAVGSALALADSDHVLVSASLEKWLVVLTLAGGSQGWSADVLARLEGWEASVVNGDVVVRLARTPLRAV